MNSKKVNIIVLNYNNYQDTIECVDSILQLNYTNYNLIVIDNASTNNSFDHLKNHFKFLKENSPSYNYQLLDENETYIFDESCQLYLTRSNENNGYSSGNNIGIDISMKYTHCEYIWILNNDTIVDIDSLTNQVNYFESEIKHGKNLGILGSKLLNYFDQDKIQAVAGSYNKVWGFSKSIGLDKNSNEISQIDANKIDYINGASMFVSRNFILNVGFLATEYFLYFEELDWAQKARANKFSLGYCNDSLVYHKGGASVHFVESLNKNIKSQFYSKNYLTEYHHTKSKLIYTHKYYPKFKNHISIYIGILLIILNRLRKGLLKNIYFILKALYDFKSENRKLKASKLSSVGSI